MELTPRKQAILAAIVKYHIATGAPVGSKWLTTTLENAPSSATLRNEMSELSSMGFLTQPHTSAGRIPTDKGYEFYVSNLMQTDEIQDREKQYIDKVLEEASVDTENVRKVAAKVLSHLTGLVTFEGRIASEEAVIKKVQINLLSPRLIMMVIITDDGRTKSKLIKSGSAFSESMLSILQETAKKSVEGKCFKELTFATMQNIYASLCINALDVMSIIANLFDMINEMAQPEIEFFGETNIYSMLMNSEKAAQLLMFLRDKDAIMQIVSEKCDKKGIIFGADTVYKELENATLIVAPFGDTGRIGVIGPTRMSYGHIVSLTNYLATKLNEVLDKNIKDLEEI